MHDSELEAVRVIKIIGRTELIHIWMTKINFYKVITLDNKIVILEAIIN